MSASHVPPLTPDSREEILESLRDLIPGAFPDGVLDVDALLEIIGEGASRKPSFSFSWPGIEEARIEARAATSAALVPDLKASLNWDVASDVLIEGENLQVLKILKNGYDQQVKLIYIDPPYNTGETFTYNDTFAVSESDYLAASGQVDELGNAVTSRIERGGRKHAPWLTMMFPRLTVARHLLRRDGVILVSIDNNEVHHLRLLLDAIFGADNFVDMLTWQGGRKGDGRLTAGGQDYVLAYARDRAHLRELDVRWRERKSGLEPVYAKSDELLAEYKEDFEAAGTALRKWYRDLPDGNPVKQHSHFSQIDSGGVWASGDASSPNYRLNLVYEFEGYPSPANGWRYERSVMERLSKEGKLLYPDDTSGRVRMKRYLKDQEEWSPGSVFYKERGASQTALNTLMGASVFDFPKDLGVLARFVDAITEDGDLVIDFFAGSGSTGQAVWEQNRADGKHRNWVLVQAPEVPDESQASGRAAVEEGYETIFEITAERLRRAAAQLSDDSLLSPEYGFRIFRTKPTSLAIDPPIRAVEGMTGENYVQEALTRAQCEPVVNGSDPFEVAWEIVQKSTATRLDARVQIHNLNGVEVFEFVSGTADEPPGRLLVSLDAFNLDTAEKLDLTNDDTLILRGDKVEDGTTLTLAPRLQAKLVLLERVPREVSL